MHLDKRAVISATRSPALALPQFGGLHEPRPSLQGTQNRLFAGMSAIKSCVGKTGSGGDSNFQSF